MADFEPTGFHMNDDFLTDHPDLEKLFEKLRQDPNSLIFAPLADACRKVGRIEEALEICSRGTAQHPEYASGQVVLGKCHYDNKEMDEAAETFNTVLSLDENNLVALKYLGMILAEKGEANAAREHFRHILALDPENAQIRAKLEHLQADRSGKKEPGSAIDPDNLIDPGTIPNQEFEGKTISLGEADETSDEFATLTLAGIYAAQGYTSKAIKIYREILKDHPDNPQAREKLAALESKNGSDSPPGETAEGPSSAPTAEPLDLEMEELSDATEGQGAEAPAGRTVDRRSPAIPEDVGSDPGAAGSSESETPSRPAAPAGPEPAGKSGKSIDEQAGQRHFQDWIRRLGQ